MEWTSDRWWPKVLPQRGVDSWIKSCCTKQGKQGIVDRRLAFHNGRNQILLMSENEKIVNSGVPWIIATETNGWHHFGVKKPMDVHITLQRIPGMEAIQVGLAAWNFQAPCFFFTAYRQYREQNHINLDSRIYSSFQTEKGKEWESTIIMLSSIWILPMRHLGS